MELIVFPLFLWLSLPCHLNKLLEWFGYFLLVFRPTCWFKFMNVWHKEKSRPTFFSGYLFFFFWFLRPAVFVRLEDRRIPTQCPCVWPDTWHKHLVLDTSTTDWPPSTSAEFSPGGVLVSTAGGSSPPVRVHLIDCRRLGTWSCPTQPAPLAIVLASDND